MKITNISEAQGFFNAVKTCTGSVELVTAEGDRLNLRSTLCQYIALTQMFQEKRVDGLELLLSEPTDAEKLIPFIN